jgi:hypothetical protein
MFCAFSPERLVVEAIQANLQVRDYYMQIVRLFCSTFQNIEPIMKFSIIVAGVIKGRNSGKNI